MLMAAEFSDGASDAASDAAQDAAQEVYYHLQETDVDALFTLMSGAVTVELFTLFALLLLLGVALVLVFVITMRRV